LRPNIPALWSSKISSVFVNVSNATDYRLINICDFITSKLSDFAVDLLPELHSILEVPVWIIVTYNVTYWWGGRQKKLASYLETGITQKEKDVMNNK
jgi:hypothetical protein